MEEDLERLSATAQTAFEGGDFDTGDAVFGELLEKTLKIYPNDKSRFEATLNQLLPAYTKAAGPEHLGPVMLRNVQGGLLLDLERHEEAVDILCKAHGEAVRLLGWREELTQEIANRLVQAYSAKALWGNALAIGQKLLQVRTEAFGTDHPATLDAASVLADTLKASGDLNEARAMQATVLEVRERVLGSDHPDSIACAYKLATTLRALDDQDGARRLLARTLDVVRLRYGADDLETASASIRLANALYDLGDLQAASELEADVYRIRKLQLGGEDLRTLRAATSLSQTLNDLGRSQEALSVLETTYDLLVNVAGATHEDTRRCAMQLVQSLYGLGHYPKALGLVRALCKATESAIGAEHDDTLRALLLQAGVLSAAGDPQAALAIEERVVEVLEKSRGPRDPDTLTALGNMALTVKDLGDVQRALSILQRVYETEEEVLGDQLSTQKSANNLAAILCDLGEYERAQELHERAIAGSINLLGESHPTTLQYLQNLAAVYHRLGKLAEAAEILVKVHKTAVEQVGADHPTTLQAAHNLAENLLARGLYTEAKSLQEQTLVAWQELVGEAHPASLQATNSLANTHRLLGSLQVAKQMQSRLVELASQGLGSDHPIALVYANNFALTLFTLGELAEARAMYENALEKLENRHGSYHAEALTVAGNLAMTLNALGDRAGARARAEAVVEAREKSQGYSHPDTLKAKANLALLLDDAVEARRILDQGREETVRTLGESHFDSLTAASNLAVADAKLDDAKSAVMRLERALSVAEAAHGSDHPLTLQLLNNFANLLEHTGPGNRGGSLHEQLLKARERLLGPLRLETLSSLFEVARHSLQDGDVTRAEALWTEFFERLGKARDEGDELFELATSALSLVGPSYAEGAAKSLSFSRLSSAIAAASARLQLLLEVRDDNVASAARKNFVKFHRFWLEACTRSDPANCLRPLIMLHGSEAWRLICLGVAQGGRVGSTSVQASAFLEAHQVLARVRQSITHIDLSIRDAMSAFGVSASMALSSTDTPIQALPQLESLRTERARLELQERAALRDYVAARTALAESTGNAGETFWPRMEDVLAAARLRDSDGLVVLFEGYLEDSPDLMALVVRRKEAPIVVQLPRALDLAIAAYRYVFRVRSDTRSMGLRDVEIGVEREADAAVGSPSEMSASDLHRLGREALWSPLEQLAADVSTWHVVTGPALHAIPFQFGIGGTRAHFYCGLPAMYRLRTTAATSDWSEVPQLSVSCDASWRSAKPLPFVDAEAGLISSLVADSAADVVRRDGLEVFSASSKGPWLHIACHGRIVGDVADPISGVSYGALLVDSEHGTLVDLQTLSRLPPNVTEVFASACVGGIMTQTGYGDVLGLPAALNWRGVTVVACLAPVPDFYMPVLASLYWYARAVQNFAAPEALRVAKRQLSMGDWPDVVTVTLERVYSEHMHSLLLKLSQLLDADPETPLARALLGGVLRGWSLPTDFPRTVSVAEFRRQYCRNDRVRTLLVTQTLKRLIGERLQPAADVRAQFDHLCAFTVCWGTGDPR